MDEIPYTSTTVSPDARARDLRSFWRWVLALVAPLPFLALAVNMWVLPFDLRADLPALISGIAQHPERTEAGLWLSLVFVLFAVPAVIAVAWSSRRSAPWLSLTGGVIGVVAFAEAGTGAGTELLAFIGVTHHLTAAQIVGVSEAIAEHPGGQIGVPILVIGQAVSLVLLGIALWRSPLAPTWMGAVLAISGPSHLLIPGGNAGAGGSWLLTAVGCVGASIALLRTSNASFDLAPENARVPPTDDDEPPLPTPSLRTRTTTRTPSVTTTHLDSRTGWRILLAITAPIAAVAIAIFRFLLPYNTPDDPDVIFDKLLANPGFQSAAIWLGPFLAPMVVTGVLAVAWVSRRRAPLLTTIGTVLAFLGFTALVAGGSLADLITYATSDGAIDRKLGYQVASAAQATPQSVVLGSVFVFGHLIGTVILGIALWRSRAVNWTFAVALTISQPIHLVSAMTGNHPLDLVGWGLTAVGFGAAGWKLLHTTNDRFDLPPIAMRHVPSPKAIAARP